MFLTCLILKMSFFICQKNPWLRFLLMSNGNPMTNENDYMSALDSEENLVSITCDWKFSTHSKVNITFSSSFMYIPSQNGPHFIPSPIFDLFQRDSVLV